MNPTNTENPAEGFLTRQPPTFDSIDEEGKALLKLLGMPFKN